MPITGCPPGRSWLKRSLARRETFGATLISLVLLLRQNAGRTGSSAGCFSKVVTKPLPEGQGGPIGQPPHDASTIAAAPAAEAWLLAAKRTAAYKDDAPVYWEAAWETTEAWWLRPVAHAVASLLCVGAVLQRPRRLVVKATQAWEDFAGSLFRRASNMSSERKLAADARQNVLSGYSPTKEANDAKAATIRRALSRLELPFFATSSKYVDRQMTGVLVSGNFRPGTLDCWMKTESALREHLERELDQPIVIHLLRRSDEEDQLSVNQRFELLVADPVIDEGVSEMEAMGLVTTLVAALWCTTGLGSVNQLQQLGAVVQPGSSLPTVFLFGLVLFAEFARSVVAKSEGVELGPRTFLPSAQVGLLGSFAAPKTPASSRSSALKVAVSWPVAMTICSLMLLLVSSTVPSLGGDMDLRGNVVSSSAWPLALLSTRCSAGVWAGAQGLLMAALALLPHSPDGRSAWKCLLGRKKGDTLGDACAYIYPIIGLIAMWGYGPGFMALPMTWALLLVNVYPRSSPPPLEEASDVPEVGRIAAQVFLVAAAVAALPLPLNLILNAVSLH
eukprot:TRINITY_DN41195_c0_g1_i1.p1 TRINITY_DN41195_c0_g1~~TRINITY_DN41195_c0_g1_i1.p1  ORF type:complete len:561 (-),score=94.44 TRINITY_DN41195_c0_g1_i1:21-1703(-)